MKFRRALAVAVGAVALLAPATPSFAALYVHGDAVQDVVKETCVNDFEDCTDAVDPTMANGDITRVVVRHQANRVLLRVRQRELVAGENGGHFVRIVTNEGKQRFVIVSGESGSTRPETMMIRARDFSEQSCSGLWAGYDGVEDLVTVIIPRRCLSYPRWVRVGVLAGHDDGTDTGDITWVDDMMLNGKVGDFFAALTPRIRRS